MQKAKKIKLQNGITAIIQEMDSVESATLGFWVNAGGVTETVANYGISHFLEHMVFKGTANRTAKQIAEDIENVGGYLNAYTARNVTAFHAKVLKENIELAIDILSDMLITATFPAEELERERGVVLQEIGQTIDDPNDIIFDYFQSTAFPDQPMGRPILGTTKIVSNITADDLRNYKNTFYNPDNMIFSVAGNCCADNIVELLEKYTNKMQQRETLKAAITPEYKGGYFSDFRPKLEQTHLILGFEGIKYTDKNYYTASLFSSILGEGMSSRLFQEIREKRGLVYSVYSFNSCYREAGLFGVYAATSANKAEEVLDIVYNEIEKMCDNITEKEFNRTKAQYKSTLLMGRESTAAVCEQSASQTLLFGQPLDIHQILDKINSVSVDMVREYAKKILDSAPTLVSVGNTNCEKWFANRTK